MRQTGLILTIVPVVASGVLIGIFGLQVFWGVLGVLAGLIFLSLSILYERFALYLLIVMLPLVELLRVDLIPSTLLIIPGGLAIVSLLASIVLRKKKIFISSPLVLLAVLLGVWASIATASVGSISESRPYWLVIVLLFLVPNAFTRKEHLLRACWLFLLPLGVLGAYVFFSRLFVYLGAQEISMESLHLANLGIGGKNIIGMWLTQGIVFVYYLFNHYKNEPGKRFWLLTSGGAMFAGALATLSISVAIGLSIMVALIAWLQPRVIARLRALTLGIAIILIIFSGPISERMQNQNLTSLDENWGTYRGAIWEAGYRTIMDHPVLGIGLKPARRSAMMKYTDIWFVQQWYALGILVVPHNIFLSVGVETGLPGLVLYLALLSAVFFLLWNLRRREEYLEAFSLQVFANILLVALIVGWVQGMALSVHLDKIMWFLMGSAIALGQIARNEMLSQE